MNRLWVLLLCVPAFAAGVIPNRYIVQLSTEPVARHTGSRRQLHTAEAERHRATLRAEQATARARIQAIHGHVRGAVENVGNLLFVDIPDADAAQLSKIPGVLRVMPVRNFHLLLDHALPLHNVPQAWTQVGISNAGAGIRIGIIDTGIDISHPGFNDHGFTAPSGFPIADSKVDMAYTNNKVIVARSYAAYFPAQDPDPSAADQQGHGTATAMAAGGVMNAGPLATISGVAPAAYLGSYKVFGTPGYNDGAPDDAIIAAMEDALGDGMDIISMSLGGDIAFDLEFDVEAQVLSVIRSAGMIAVIAAGNNGNDPNTIASPGDSPDAISVGASNNDRVFAASAQLSSASPLMAIPGTGANSATPISAPLQDVATIDGNGLACGGFPANSLQGTIAFISRGTCTFEIKLNNAAAAGATAALLYDNVAGESPITMSVQSATLPAEMISNQDGLALKAQLTTAQTATLNFGLAPFYVAPAGLANFSAAGPNVDLSIKPDLVAVGVNMYTAAQKLNPNGPVYSPSGYSIEQGTSFSTPLVAGAAAVLKQYRPGLTVDQYRSLLIDSAGPAFTAPGSTARVQQSGGGLLDVFAAINATAAIVPASLSYGQGNGTIDTAQAITVTNVGAVSDTFQLAVAPRDSSAPAPQLSAASVQLDAGASTVVFVTLRGDGMSAGQYEGFITVQGMQSSTVSHVPYWYAVASTEPAHITVLENVGNNGTPSIGSSLSQAVVFRITDASGLPLSDVVPVVKALTNGARVTGISSLNSYVPGAYSMSARLSNTPGANTFQIEAGQVTLQVSITGK